jgi:hypothetical protein
MGGSFWFGSVLNNATWDKQLESSLSLSTGMSEDDTQYECFRRELSSWNDSCR